MVLRGVLKGSWGLLVFKVRGGGLGEASGKLFRAPCASVFIWPLECRLGRHGDGIVFFSRFKVNQVVVINGTKPASFEWILKSRQGARWTFATLPSGTKVLAMGY